MKTLGQILPQSLIRKTKVRLDQPILGLSHSSKDVKTGEMYFAIRGTKTDGHSFVGEVSQRGAAAVVEDSALYENTPNAVLVRSTREALAIAAVHWFGNPSEKLHLVGVTGTNGKTTSTYLLRAIWNALKCTNGIVGTVEAVIGDEVIPSTMTTPGPMELQGFFNRMVEKKTAYAAVEVTSIAIDQYRTAGTHFDVGIFTNLTLDHLDYHGSLEKYRDTKLRFFQEYSLGAAVLNIDDPVGELFYRQTTAERKLSFSLKNDKADLAVLEADFTKKGTDAVIRTPRGLRHLHVSLIGKHNLYNCLGVLAAVEALGQDTEIAALALSQTSGAPGRLERIMTGEKYPSIFVDYAHSDDALYNVLVSLTDLRKSTHGRIITVFGCGGDRDRTKRPKMAEVVSKLSDVSIATSDNPRTEDPEKIIDEMESGIQRGKTEYYREVNRRKAIRSALDMAKPEDLVLIAGKGHETYQIIGTEKFPFDDSEVIREYYGTIKVNV